MRVLIAIKAAIVKFYRLLTTPYQVLLDEERHTDEKKIKDAIGKIFMVRSHLDINGKLHNSYCMIVNVEFEITWDDYLYEVTSYRRELYETIIVDAVYKNRIIRLPESDIRRLFGKSMLRVK